MIPQRNPQLGPHTQEKSVAYWHLPCVFLAGVSPNYYVCYARSCLVCHTHVDFFVVSVQFICSMCAVRSEEAGPAILCWSRLACVAGLRGLVSQSSPVGRWACVAALGALPLCLEVLHSTRWARVAVVALLRSHFPESLDREHKRD